MQSAPNSGSGTIARGQGLARVAPGLAMLLAYKRMDFPHDLVAGLSVAAVE
jgi:hypothetical protein